jgi:hypothetical protein
MQDVFDPFDRLLNRFAVSHIALDEGESFLGFGMCQRPSEVGSMPSRQIIQGTDRCTSPQESFHKVGADEPATARD